jgi:hypothetical protein
VGLPEGGYSSIKSGGIVGGVIFENSPLKKGSKRIYCEFGSFHLVYFLNEFGV